MDSSDNINNRGNRKSSILESHVVTLLDQLKQVKNQHKNALIRGAHLKQINEDLRKKLADGRRSTHKSGEVRKLKEKIDNREKELSELKERENQLRNTADKYRNLYLKLKNQKDSSLTSQEDKFQRIMESTVKMLNEVTKEIIQVKDELNDIRSLHNDHLDETALIKAEYETKIMELQQELESFRVTNTQLLMINNELKNQKNHPDMNKSKLNKISGKQCELEVESILQNLGLQTSTTVKREHEEKNSQLRDEKLNKKMRPKRMCSLKNSFQKAFIKLEENDDPILLSSDCDSDSTIPEEGMENENYKRTIKKMVHDDEISIKRQKTSKNLQVERIDV